MKLATWNFQILMLKILKKNKKNLLTSIENFKDLETIERNILKFIKLARSGNSVKRYRHFNENYLNDEFFWEIYLNSVLDSRVKFYYSYFYVLYILTAVISWNK